LIYGRDYEIFFFVKHNPTMCFIVMREFEIQIKGKERKKKYQCTNLGAKKVIHLQILFFYN